MGELRKEEMQHENVWKALAKYGIHSEAELNEAIKKMKPLNIGCMVSPAHKRDAVAAK